MGSLVVGKLPKDFRPSSGQLGSGVSVRQVASLPFELRWELTRYYGHSRRANQ